MRECMQIEISHQIIFPFYNNSSSSIASNGFIVPTRTSISVGSTASYVPFSQKKMMHGTDTQLYSSLRPNHESDSMNRNEHSWIQSHKKTLTIAASAALIAAAAFVPSSFAIAPVDPSSTVAVSNVVSSASNIMDQLYATGFYQAFSLVFVSEIGDKTFFIAGILAAKLGRFISLVGAVGALAVMTIISVLIGQIFHAVPPGISQGIPLDDVAAVLAFAFFGVKTLKEASEIDPEGGSGMDEEYADAEEAVEGSTTIREVTAWGKIISTFGLVFAAEFGDRSFISTIALSAAQNPFSVAAGGIAAHALATGIAVAGGSYVSKFISEKAIGYIGGTLFLVFAVTTALGLF